jgi:trehalose 6-phosphate synthase
MSRLVVVSNRLPALQRNKAAAGGLAVALSDALKPGTVWFGWSGRCTSRSVPRPEMQKMDGLTFATIDLTKPEYEAYYVGFGNSALWPLLSFRLGLISFRPSEYEGYRAVNRRFALELADLLHLDDLVWVHDYMLIPLGLELRARGVKNRLGFFLHTPFPPPALMAVLPRAGELVEALCAFDVIGFQTATFRDAFLACVTDMLGIVPDDDGVFEHQGRFVRSIVDPVGINADAFAQAAARAVQATDTRRLVHSLSGRSLVIGVDRLDYAKGLPNRIEAIVRLFEKYPEYRRQVSFLQIAAASREDVADFQRLRRQLDHAVGETNGRLGEADWTPLRYMTRPHARGTLAGFYRVARIGMVTPLRDGMNLVAKEYIAAQDPADPGVLVLSRFAGAANELSEALLVNPLDADAIADAIHASLRMDLEERRARHEVLLAKVRFNTASRYCERFLAELRGMSTPWNGLPHVAVKSMQGENDPLPLADVSHRHN